MSGFENAERLTSVFGRWPSFHDAEILRVVLDRAGEGGPSLAVDVHVFEMTSTVDARGYYVSKNHHVARLEFCKISLDDLAEFMNQNVIFELVVSAIDPATNEGRRFHVSCGSSIGCHFELDCARSIGCHFELDCARMVVDDVRPFTPSSRAPQ